MQPAPGRDLEGARDLADQRPHGRRGQRTGAQQLTEGPALHGLLDDEDRRRPVAGRQVGARVEDARDARVGEHGGAACGVEELLGPGVGGGQGADPHRAVQGEVATAELTGARPVGDGELPVEGVAVGHELLARTAAWPVQTYPP